MTKSVISQLKKKRVLTLDVYFWINIISIMGGGGDNVHNFYVQCIFLNWYGINNRGIR